MNNLFSWIMNVCISPKIHFWGNTISQHFLFSFISAKIFILFLSSFLLQFNAFLVKTSPLLARKFLVQTFIFSVFTPENKAKTKAIGKDSSSRKEKKKGKICWKIKVFGKDRSNLAKGLWSRSLLRQKRRPWSSFPMTQGLQNYYIAWFIQLRKDKGNCPEEDKSFLLKHLVSRHFPFSFIKAKLFILFLSAFPLHF